jgi:hypothetical protein
LATNTKEAGLEELIVNVLVQENGYEQGSNEDYNRACAVDETRLFRYLENTQKTEMASIGLPSGGLGDTVLKIHPKPHTLVLEPLVNRAAFKTGVLKEPQQVGKL